MFYRFSPYFIVFIFLSPALAEAVLEGQVLDRLRGRPLKGAIICVADSLKCGRSDNAGNFHLRGLEPGLNWLSAELTGYEILRLDNLHIKTGVNERLILQLERREKIIELTSATVKTRKSRFRKQGQAGSVTRFNNFTLNNKAGTYNDIYRVMEMLPSVVSGVGSNFDNNLYVRGGHPSENVFIIDGIEVDNVSHFGGFDESGGKIGFINPALVTKLDFYAGAVPVNLPPRLSSVTEMEFREGS